MGIDGIIYEKRGIEHEDDRRVLLTAFNGDLGDFVARQVKFALIRQDAVLGGHYHDYHELFYLLQGGAIFDLKHTLTGALDRFRLKAGDRLFIPAHVAHKGYVKQGSILVGCTEEAYISPEHNDHNYDF